MGYGVVQADCKFAYEREGTPSKWFVHIPSIIGWSRGKCGLRSFLGVVYAVKAKAHCPHLLPKDSKRNAKGQTKPVNKATFWGDIEGVQKDNSP